MSGQCFCLHYHHSDGLSTRDNGLQHFDVVMHSAERMHIPEYQHQSDSLPRAFYVFRLQNISSHIFRYTVDAQKSCVVFKTT